MYYLCMKSFTMLHIFLQRVEVIVEIVLFDKPTRGGEEMLMLVWLQNILICINNLRG